MVTKLRIEQLSENVATVSGSPRTLDNVDGSTITGVDAASVQGRTVGTGEGQIVELTGSPIGLPAVDGSNLTGISSTPSFRGARVYSQFNQTLASTGVPGFIIKWGSVIYDTDSIHTVGGSPLDSRLTVPTGVTFVRLTAFGEFDFDSAGVRRMEILKNGAEFDTHARIIVDAGASIDTSINISLGVVPCVGGDYFEVRALQNSGGNLAFNGGVNGSWFAMEIVE